MTEYNAENERVKRAYLTYIEEALGHSEQTIDGVAKAIARFESHTRWRDFKAFHIEQTKSFKRHLAEQKAVRSREPLSKATIFATLAALKQFFVWLAGQPGYKSRIAYSDAEYFNPSTKDARIAKASRPQRVPTVEQINSAIQAMPANTVTEKRDRALMAFALLTGARDGAIASFKLSHIDIEQGFIFQDAREVNTKFSKTFTTVFFPVGQDVRRIVTEWVQFLQREQLWGLDDPLFPATRIVVGNDRRFKVLGIERRHWSNAGPIRKIFKEAFARVGLPYFNPHSLRKTLTLLGQQKCKTPEEYKAWSQNLGHDNVLTTFQSYGTLSDHRQAEIIQAFSRR